MLLGSPENVKCKTDRVFTIEMIMLVHQTKAFFSLDICPSRSVWSSGVGPFQDDHQVGIYIVPPCSCSVLLKLENVTISKVCHLPEVPNPKHVSTQTLRLRFHYPKDPKGCSDAFCFCGRSRRSLSTLSFLTTLMAYSQPKNWVWYGMMCSYHRQSRFAGNTKLIRQQGCAISSFMRQKPYKWYSKA